MSTRHDLAVDQTAGPGVRRPIGYVLGRFPTTSETFVHREISALEDLGLPIVRISVNPVAENEVHTAGERRHRSLTLYIKAQPLRSILLAVALALRTRPLAYLRVIARAMASARFDFKAAVWRLFHVVEATVVWRHCNEKGVRHLHAHLSQVPATVAWYTAELGNRLEPGSGWSWSMTTHGWREFVNEDAHMLRDKVVAAQFVACVSDYTRSQLMRIAPSRHWAKLHVVRCGLDFSSYEPAPQRSDFTRPRILTVARLSSEKGHLVLLEAMSILAEQARTVDLDLIGSGDLEAEIVDAIACRGLSGRVRLLGALGSPEVAEALRSANVFCLPSFAEGLPVSLMEAMAVGVPVVTTGISGTPELVVNEVTGLLVPPGRADLLAAAIERIVDDIELRERVIAGAAKRVRHRHDIRRTAELMNELFSGCHEVGRRREAHIGLGAS